MGLFSKKEEVPELPPAPTLPDLPASTGKNQLPELPSFPQSSKNENLNQEIVKSAVIDTNDSGVEEMNMDVGGASAGLPPPQRPQGIPPLPGSEGLTPMFPTAKPTPEPKLPTVPEPPMTVEVDEEEIKEIKPRAQPMEPIFVRLDKFEASQESLEKIRSKIDDIENTLSKIKAVKEKENDELDKWAEEMETLKSRLSDIDDNIFSQI